MKVFIPILKVVKELFQEFRSQLLLLLPLFAGTGADPSRPPCRKARDLRKERRLQKEQMRQHVDGVPSIVSSTPSTPTPVNQAKALEDFIDESLPDDSSHCLEVSRNTG